MTGPPDRPPEPGAAMTDLDLLQLNPRKEMARIREAIRARLDAGESPGSLIRALAVRDSAALADLLIGPRAFGDPPVIAAAIDVIETLEGVIRPDKLYPRLADLAGGGGVPVLRCAIARHPAAPWLVALSARVEGAHAGATHIRMRAGRSDFAEICDRYAMAGHLRGLVRVGGELATAQPAASLARAGAAGPAAEAAARALDKDPGVPVVAWLAATWGPDVEVLLLGMVPYLRDLAAIRAFARQAETFPAVAQRLASLDGS